MRFREGKLKEARAKVAVTEKALAEKAAALAVQDKQIAEMQAEYRRDRAEQQLLERERDDTEEAERLIHVMTSNLREMQGAWTQQLSAVCACVPRNPPRNSLAHRPDSLTERQGVRLVGLPKLLWCSIKLRVGPLLQLAGRRPQHRPPSISVARLITQIRTPSPRSPDINKT